MGNSDKPSVDQLCDPDLISPLPTIDDDIIDSLPSLPDIDMAQLDGSLIITDRDRIKRMIEFDRLAAGRVPAKHLESDLPIVRRRRVLKPPSRD